MTRRQLVVVQLTVSILLFIAFLVAIIFAAPKLLHQVEDYSEDYLSVYAAFADTSCPQKFKGYCLNGGTCFYSEDAEGPACNCTDPYGGKRCEKYMWYT